MPGSRRVWSGCFQPPGPFEAFNSKGPNQPGCLIPSNSYSIPAGCVPEFANPIKPPVRLTERIKLPRQHNVTEGSCRRGAGSSVILGTWCHLQHPADEPRVKLASLNHIVCVGLDKVNYYRRWPPGSIPKKRTPAASSSAECRRPDFPLWSMRPSSFPKYGNFNKPRTVHVHIFDFCIPCFRKAGGTHL